MRPRSFAGGKDKIIKSAFLFLLLIFTGGHKSLMACSTCGCSASATDFGILQSWGTHTLGLQYRLDRFDNGVTEEGLRSSDRINTWNLNGIWSPAERWQIQVQVPYRLQTRNTGDELNTRHGIGDTWLIGRYAVMMKESEEDQSGYWLSLGAGLKTPTGEFKSEEDNLGLPLNSQIGTGSVDFMLEVRTQYRITDWAIQAEAIYRYNTENLLGYRFGNQYAAAVDARWTIPTSHVRMGLLGGIYAERFLRDSKRSFWRDDTGGEGIYASTGCFASVGKWSGALRYRIPLSQNYGAGQVRSEGPLDASIIYQF